MSETVAFPPPPLTVRYQSFSEHPLTAEPLAEIISREEAIRRVHEGLAVDVICQGGGGPYTAALRRTPGYLISWNMGVMSQGGYGFTEFPRQLRARALVLEKAADLLEQASASDAYSCKRKRDRSYD